MDHLLWDRVRSSAPERMRWACRREPSCNPQVRQGSPGDRGLGQILKAGGSYQDDKWEEGLCRQNEKWVQIALPRSDPDAFPSNSCAFSDVSQAPHGQPCAQMCTPSGFPMVGGGTGSSSFSMTTKQKLNWPLPSPFTTVPKESPNVRCSLKLLLPLHPQ